MDRGTVLLQGLRGQLQGWLDPIKRGTCATSVAFVTMPEGEFKLRIEWGAGPHNTSYEKEFTKAFVFGSSFSGNPHGWRVEKRACDHARAVMREVLQQRGVL